MTLQRYKPTLEERAKFVNLWSDASKTLKDIGKELGMTESVLMAQAMRLRRSGVPLAHRRH